MGIDKYNDLCRGIVMKFSELWRKTVHRLGRWIDFDNDYRTMYPSYMESVWWVFAQLFEKELVYRGTKVMAYSTACATPLSNFEAGSSYRDKQDPAVFVTFPSVDDENLLFVAWTTTPWTLPSNLALCVHPTMQYVVVRDTKPGDVEGGSADARYVVLEALLASVFGAERAAQMEVVERVAGEALVGRRYRPLFDYFVAEFGETAYRIVADTYVTAESGSGVVHQAPAFGEDDSRVCLANGVTHADVPAPCPLDANARFLPLVADFAGQYVFDANPMIIRHLKMAGRVLRWNTITHSYPFCWRSDTPLVYRAIPCWFIRVTALRERLREAAATTRFVPEHVLNRFDNWLESTHDWAVSRNRFWGTPLPLWASEDYGEVVCVRSIDHLEELSGVRVTDLHRESVDHIEIVSKATGATLRRVEEVYDCWFESGAMPYAQQHYPFENKERFEANFPADFIAEGLDQTRGWFYTLLVISVALFDKPAWKNVIVNGLVLASDGKKMSKRLKNYPDPALIVDKYGADAMRLYLINSPVVKGEEFRFREEGLRETTRSVFLPWFNAYRFFFLATLEYRERADNVEHDELAPDFDVAARSSNLMDRWLISKLQSLVLGVRLEMEAYRLDRVVPPLVDFVEQLTNWYVRFNRTRLKGYNDTAIGDQLAALNTLYFVLLTVAKLMAPLTPFFTEFMYRNLARLQSKSASPQASSSSAAASSSESTQCDDVANSVHFQRYPVAREQLIDERMERTVALMQQVIEAGRRLRDQNARPVRTPLTALVVLVADDDVVAELHTMRDFVLSELNVQKLVVKNDLSLVQRCASPNLRTFGRKTGRYVADNKSAWLAELDGDNKKLRLKIKEVGQQLRDAVCALSDEQVRALEASGKHALEPFGLELTLDDVVLDTKMAASGGAAGNDDDSSVLAQGEWAAESIGDSTIVALDVLLNDALIDDGILRDIGKQVQLARKAAGLVAIDPVDAFIRVAKNPAKSHVLKVLSEGHAELMKRLNFAILPYDRFDASLPVIDTSSASINAERVEIVLSFHTPCASRAAIERHGASLTLYLAHRSPEALLASLDAERRHIVTLDGQRIELTYEQDFFLSVSQRELSNQ
jgi:isoleucyl-tRNA synthetase